MGRTNLLVYAVWVMMYAIPTNGGAPVLERTLNKASVPRAFPLVVTFSPEAQLRSSVTSAVSKFSSRVQISGTQTVFQPNLLDLPDGVLVSALVTSMLAAFLAIRLLVAQKSSR
jgi:hypothetical protein